MLDMIEQRAAAVHTDPIWRLLHDRLHIRSRWSAMILAWSIGAICTFLIPSLTGYLMPRDGIISALGDWPTLFINFLTAPIVYAYYIYDYPDMFEDLLQGLRANASQPAASAQNERMFARMSAAMAWRGWYPLAMLLAVGGTGAWVMDVLRHPVPSYYSEPQVVLIVHFLRVGLPLYMALVMATRHFLVTLPLFSYFRAYKPVIHALHPDRCGGLAYLGRFSLRGAFFIGIVALNLSFMIMHNLQILKTDPFGDVSITGAAVIYFIVAPLIFFMALAPAHQGMSDAKIEAEEWISREADKLYAAIQSDLRQGKVDPPSIARLEDLHRLQKMTREFPVWPFDTGTVGRFATAVFLPLVPPIVLELIKVITAWLGG